MWRREQSLALLRIAQRGLDVGGDLIRHCGALGLENRKIGHPDDHLLVLDRGANREAILVRRGGPGQRDAERDLVVRLDVLRRVIRPEKQLRRI